MDAEELPPSATAQSNSAQRFHNGQCVVLQNLVTHSDLNDKPARVVDYKEELGKYVISGKPARLLVCYGGQAQVN